VSMDNYTPCGTSAAGSLLLVMVGNGRWCVGGVGGDFSHTVQTVYARGGGGGGSQQRQFADGADVVFTDTVYNYILIRLQLITDKLVSSSVSIA